jgi:hypothetical protein
MREGKGDKMTRALGAQLSPNEELALRKIAQGIVRQNEIRDEEVRRLQNFGFVEIDTAGPRLTPLGAQRTAMTGNEPNR